MKTTHYLLVFSSFVIPELEMLCFLQENLLLLEDPRSRNATIFGENRAVLSRG